MSARLIIDPVEFLALVKPHLIKNEALNNVQLGIAMRFAERSRAGETFAEEKLRMAVVEQGEKVVGMMLQTPPRDLIMSLEIGFESEMAALTALVEEKGWDFSGLVGQGHCLEAFGATWQGHAFEKAAVTLAYQLTEVIPPRKSPGIPRLAEMADLKLLTSWFGKFIEEAMGEMDKGATRDLEMEQRIVKGWIEGKKVLVWENGEPTCMAVFARTLENGMAVSYVYTPIDHRGSGYASNLVAHMSQLVLDKGFQWAVLFADGINPTSNRIYQRIGYKEIGRSFVWKKK